MRASFEERSHGPIRAGVIQVQNAAGQYVPYNLNPSP